MVIPPPTTGPWEKKAGTQSTNDANLPDANLKDEEETPRGPRKGNPRRLGKKARAARRALGRLGPGRLP